METQIKTMIKQTIKAAAILLTAFTLQAQAGTQIYFIHNDHLGTPQVVTDANQNVVWKGHQKPFGETQEVTATIDQQARFPGQYFDEESGLSYNYFRDYDPTTGRYLQSDPIGLNGGINTYSYVQNNPLMYTDPTGEFAILLAAPAVGEFLVGLATVGLGLYTMPGDIESPSDDSSERARENEEIHRICDEPPPLTNDLCELWKWKLNKAKSCLAARERFRDKWYNGKDDAGHARRIQQIRNEIANAERKVEIHCKEQCE